MKFFVLAAAMFAASLAIVPPKAEAYSSCTTSCYGNTCTRTCF
jgi:hypothetical protein